jgi:hypothetical protein
MALFCAGVVLIKKIRISLLLREILLLQNGNFHRGEEVNFDVKFLFRCRYASLVKKLMEFRCANKKFCYCKMGSRKNMEFWLQLCGM